MEPVDQIEQQPTANEDAFNGLRPDDIAAIDQVQNQLEKQTAKKRRGRPKKIKNDEDLQIVRELLQEATIDEDNEKRKKELYEQISKYYVEFETIFGNDYEKVSANAPLELLEIELNNVQTKVNQLGSSLFLRSSIKMTAGAIETVGSVLPIVKLGGFSTVVENQMDDYERLVKAIMLKRGMTSAAVEPEAALLALVVQSIIATHATNVYMERQSKKSQTEVKAKPNEATINKELMQKFEDL